MLSGKLGKVGLAGARSKVKRITSDAKAGTFAASEAARQMDKYVPFRTGDLAGSVTTKPWEVSYSMPYARYVWDGRGMTFSKQHHPAARSHWSEPLAAKPAPLARAISAYLKGR